MCAGNHVLVKKMFMTELDMSFARTVYGVEIQLLSSKEKVPGAVVSKYDAYSLL